MSRRASVAVSVCANSAKVVKEWSSAASNGVAIGDSILHGYAVHDAEHFTSE